MPTGRLSPGVVSLQSALIVAGGITSTSYTAAVEIFKPDLWQWYKTDELPTSCCGVSLVIINNTCHVLGGVKKLSSLQYLDQALYASVDDLYLNAVPANQTTHSGSIDTQSAWKILPNTPTKIPIAAALAGNLLAIGGRGDPNEDRRREIYMYSPSTNSWTHFMDLPAPRSGPAVAVLSSTEILVTGGFDGAKVNTGTLYLKL